jgi:hypothetical protein
MFFCRELNCEDHLCVCVSLTSPKEVVDTGATTMRRTAWSCVKNAAKRWQATSSQNSAVELLPSSHNDCLWKEHTHTSLDRREDGDTQSCSDEESICLGSEPDEADDKSEIDMILDKYLEMELNPSDQSCSRNDEVFSDEVCNRLPEDGSKGRRVRIGYDPDTGDVLCEYFGDDQSCCSSIMSQDGSTWLASVDYKRFRRESHFETLAARQSSFTTDLIGLYESCTSANGWLVVDPNQVLAVSKSDHRGLELAVHFGTMMTERKAYVQQVLQTQQLQRSLEHWTANERAEALGIQARFVSQTSRRLALVLGAGDALVATERECKAHLCTL